MQPAHVWTCLCRGVARLSLLAMLSLPFLSVPTHAKEPMSELRRVYAVVLMSRTFHSACDEIVPWNADAHQTAYDRFARKHSIKRIARYFSVWPNPVPLLPEVKAIIDKSTPAIRARVKAKPKTCVALGAFFDALVVRKLGLGGSKRLGHYFDSLLAQLKLAPPPEKAPPIERLTPVGTPVATRSDQRTDRLPGPRPIGPSQPRV